MYNWFERNLQFPNQLTIKTYFKIYNFGYFQDSEVLTTRKQNLEPGKLDGINMQFFLTERSSCSADKTNSYAFKKKINQGSAVGYRSDVHLWKIEK